MTPFYLLQQLKSRGVDLWVEGETLRYQGPAEALTPDVMDTLKKMKSTLMQVLQNNNCTGCMHHEELPAHGPGCVQTTKGRYKFQWSHLNTIEICPMGYWN